MKKNLRNPRAFFCILFCAFILQSTITWAQCTNADFENGTFGSWTGTYDKDTCGISVLGICACQISAPTQISGFNQGPNNNTVTDAVNHYEHVITTTAGGNDPNVTTLGGTLPVVWPGSGAYSARIGSMWQASGSTGDAETISYSYTVTPATCNFTYHYAVVVNDGGHPAGQQPYFNITMLDGSGTPISCAAYQVDASTAPKIGGFTQYTNAGGEAVYVKPWTSVFIPLNNFIGQTVKITFTARGCTPGQSILGLNFLCEGSHYCYAYVDAECGPLALVASSPTVCGGTTLTLTAPAGAATYKWTGPGVIQPDTNQVVFINKPGHYHVDMTTFGDVPCPFSLDTVMPANPNNPSANFSVSSTCVGSATTFTDMSTPAGSITQWAWDFDNNGTTDATGQNPTFTFPTSGTYPVHLTVTWPPCTADTIINVVVGPAPTSTFTATGPVCAGQTSTVNYTGNGTGADTYTWNWNGGSVISGGPGAGPYQVNWSTAGTKTISLTVAAGTCAGPAYTQQVVVNAFPGLTLSPNATICAGQSTTLTAAGATSYTWAPAGSLNPATGPSVVATPGTTTIYTVTGSTSTCTVVAADTVTVNPIPTSTFTASSPVCSGQNSNIAFTGTASVNATYTWNFAGGTATGAGPGPYTVNWTTATVQTYNVTLLVNDNGCPSTVTTVPVTVNPNPTSTFTASSPVCIGQNSTITFTGNATGAAVYTWGFSGGNVVQGVNAGPYQVNWPAAGSENVTLSITDNGCTSTTTTQVVAVNAFPTSTFTAATPVCAAAPCAVVFTGTASANAVYTWNFAGGTIISGSNAGPYQISWPGAGPENVTLSVTDNGCPSTTTTVPVTVNPYPTASFSTITPLCTGANSTITYTGTGTGAATYTWDFNGGNPATGNTQGPFTVNWATPGNKNITLTVSENGCTSPVTDSVIVVYPIPTSTFNAQSPVCANANSAIAYTGTASPAATYTWDFAGGTPPTGNTQGPYQVNWSTAGSENVALTVTENGCTSLPTTVTVTVNAIPPSDAGTDVTFCSGDSAAIGAASTAGYTYSWVPTTGLSNPAVANPEADGTNATSAVVTTQYIVTTSANNCSTSDSVLVTINPVPIAAFTPPAGQCFTGNSFNFVNGGTFLPAATFAWTFGPNGTPPASTTQNQTVSFSATGSQLVSLTISQNGCVSNTYVDSVNVYPIPVSAFATDTFIGCEFFPVCFVNNSVGATSYAWTFGDGNTSSAQAPCNTYVSPGVYTVDLKVTSANGCTSDSTIPNYITVIADPKAIFTTSATTIELPGQKTIDLFNDSRDAVNYIWTLGKLGNSTAFAPQMVFSDSGTYPIVLRAYNQLGCVDSTEKTVYVIPPINFYIPNVFTPNGDGNNDEFYVYAQEGVTVMKFQVFDRWGEKVHDGAYPWDGFFKGKPAAQEVYVYYTELGLAEQTYVVKRKGTVTLLR